MVWLGAAICLLVFAGIIFRLDTKLCLIGGGLLMCALSGKIGDAVPAYCESLINGNVVTYTCISMGYAGTMTSTGSTEHLIFACVRPLYRLRRMMIPFAFFVTMSMMMGLGSAATVGVAAGSVIIPLLVGLGVSPAAAAACVLMGTYGGIPFNPVSTFYVLAVENDPSGQVTGRNIIAAGFPSAVIVLFAVCASFTVCCALLEKRGEADRERAAEMLKKRSTFRVKPMSAFMPVLPLTLVMLAIYGPLDEKIFTVPTCMFIGFAVRLIAGRKDYRKIADGFFRGQGDAFYRIITLMAAAAVFTKGMGDIGLTGALVAAMKADPNIARYGAAFGPLLIGVLSGSGNAAMIAFIESVLPHSAEIGVDFAGLASVVLKTGNYGRTFSPVAAVTLVVSGIAKVEPMRVIRLTALPCLLAAVLTVLLTKI